MKQDLDEALNCYCKYNSFNFDLHVYYKEMNETQKQRLYELLDQFAQREDLDFEMLDRLYKIYSERLDDREKADKFFARALQKVTATPLEERSGEMDSFFIKHALARLKEESQCPTENTGAIPKDPKVGDVFIYGRFRGEPIEWKVLEKYDDGRVYAITKKIIVKMNYETAVEWLNTDFLQFAFTEEERSRIDGDDYCSFREETTYVYLPTDKELEKLEGTYPIGTIEQTDFARSLSKEDSVLCFDDRCIQADGTRPRMIVCGMFRGVRPVMDVYFE